jgi:hypothetical protein
VLYAGTDDGVLQYTKDGGENWTKMTVDKLPGVPASAFVNDIKIDLHNDQVAYVALDNHKYGDYTPYLYKTSNGGKKWKAITSGIPENNLVWRIVQDHVNPNLLFLATEYGVYVSLDQGNQWHKFSTGLPTISVRDLAIQKRENDLVLATFGRSFYVLDDYSALRELSEKSVEKDALLFPVRKALQYNQTRGGTSSQGGSFFTAKNPDYGAVFTFFIKEGHQSIMSKRKKKEKELKDNDIPFPGWEALDAEKNEPKAEAILVVRDATGAVVDRISAKLSKGIQRVSWDLKKPYANVVDANTKQKSINAWRLDVAPGTYSVSLLKRVGGVETELVGAQTFEVERIRKNVLANPLADQRQAYIDKIFALDKQIELADHAFETAGKRLKTLKKALKFVDGDKAKITAVLYDLLEQKHKISRMLDGNSSKKEVGEKDQLTLNYRLYFAANGLMGNSYGPTPLHMESFALAQTMFDSIKPNIDDFVRNVDQLATQMEAAGAPTVVD